MRVTDNNLPYDIGHYVLSDCVNLTAVTLPDSLTSLGEGAFAGKCNGTLLRD